MFGALILSLADGDGQGTKQASAWSPIWTADDSSYAEAVVLAVRYQSTVRCRPSSNETFG